MVVGNPGALIALLQRHGFDGTQGTSQLNYVSLPTGLAPERAAALDPAQARRLWRSLLYLPVYPGMSAAEVGRLGRLVRRHALPAAPPGEEGPSRAALLAALAGECFDLLVVGGGINGCAAARDAAMRGLRVALVERGDYAGGASGNSAKLVHGGFRYVERMQLGLVSELCAERDLQRRLNPNLVRAATFVLPQYARYGNRMRKIDFGLWLYDACAGFANALHRRLAPAAALAAEPLLRPAELLGAFTYSDCWTDDARLTLANARAAASCGAVLLNHCAFEERAPDGRGGRCRDLLSGRAVSVAARHLLVATGPALDVLGERLGLPRLLAATKGAHVAVPAARLPVRSCGGFQSPRDRRWCFCVPFFGVVVLGTTDTAADEGAGPLRATRREVEYLLEAANATYGLQLGPGDVAASWAGLRPLVREEGRRRQSVLLEAARGLVHRLAGRSSAGSGSSREERLVATRDGATLVAGGKLTPYRRVAERAVDAAVAALGRGEAAEECVTREAPLDVRLAHVAAVAANAGDAYAAHLCGAYGSEMLWVEQRLRSHPAEAALLAVGLPFLLAEVSLAVLCEQACLLDDVLVRRVPLFLLAPDNGLAAAPRVAAHLAALRGCDEAWTQQQLLRYRQLVDLAHAWKSDPDNAPPLVNLCST